MVGKANAALWLWTEFDPGEVDDDCELSTKNSGSSEVFNFSTYMPLARQVCTAEKSITPNRQLKAKRPLELADPLLKFAYPILKLAYPSLKFAYPSIKFADPL